jgi:hypothetical protein
MGLGLAIALEIGANIGGVEAHSLAYADRDQLAAAN